MKTKIQISQTQAIKIAKGFGVPDDYGCTTWAEVLADGLDHVDGLAVALGIDDDYVIDYNL